MLVLSRKQHEGLVIPTKDGVVQLVVLEISAEKVRLGIEAPKAVKVWREELDKAQDVLDRVREAAENGTLVELEGDLDREENASV
jgi:carbon storage regulator CsrA